MLRGSQLAPNTTYSAASRQGVTLTCRCRAPAAALPRAATHAVATAPWRDTLQLSGAAHRHWNHAALRVTRQRRSRVWHPPAPSTAPAMIISTHL